MNVYVAIKKIEIVNTISNQPEDRLVAVTDQDDAYFFVDTAEAVKEAVKASSREEVLKGLITMANANGKYVRLGGETIL